MKNKRKSKSPVQQYSDYLHYGQRKERTSGKFLGRYNRDSRSNMRTQCDSKAPSLSSTPISLRKNFISPQKSNISDYFTLLKSKRELIRSSIETMESYFRQRMMEER